MERTICDCFECRAPCRTMPGMLGAGDLQAIAAYQRVSPSAEWIAEHFAASEGALVMDARSREVSRVPTIVPAQRDDGDCVFLAPDGKCSIHPVSPWGCRMVDMHMDKATGERISLKGLRGIHQNRGYLLTWAFLHEAGKKPRWPLAERRARLAALLEGDKNRDVAINAT